MTTYHKAFSRSSPLLFPFSVVLLEGSIMGMRGWSSILYFCGVLPLAFHASTSLFMSKSSAYVLLFSRFVSFCFYVLQVQVSEAVEFIMHRIPFCSWFHLIYSCESYHFDFTYQYQSIHYILFREMDCKYENALEIYKPGSDWYYLSF